MKWENSKEFSDELKKKNLTIEKFRKMSGEKQADLLDKINSIDMEHLPEYLQIGDLNDDAGNLTQKIAYFLNMNEKATVLSSDEFQKYMDDNGMSENDLITRAVIHEQSLTDWLNEDETYISGRIGLHIHGYGLYFSHTKGQPLGGYGSNYLNAVVKPEAKVLNLNDFSTYPLRRAYESLPKEVQEMIPNGEDGISMIAMLAGYDAIQTYPENHIVALNRSALVTDGVIHSKY